MLRASYFYHLTKYTNRPYKNRYRMQYYFLHHCIGPLILVARTRIAHTLMFFKKHPCGGHQCYSYCVVQLYKPSVWLIKEAIWIDCKIQDGQRSVLTHQLIGDTESWWWSSPRASVYRRVGRHMRHSELLNTHPIRRARADFRAEQKAQMNSQRHCNHNIRSDTNNIGQAIEAFQCCWLLE